MGLGSGHEVEQPLTGGRLTAGVARTAGRPPSPASHLVARLLTHLVEKVLTAARGTGTSVHPGLMRCLVSPWIESS